MLGTCEMWFCRSCNKSYSFLWYTRLLWMDNCNVYWIVVTGLTGIILHIDWYYIIVNRQHQWTLEGRQYSHGVKSRWKDQAPVWFWWESVLSVMNYSGYVNDSLGRLYLEVHVSAKYEELGANHGITFTSLHLNIV